MIKREREKKTTLEWFALWRDIIYEKGEINRVTLSELSGASIWTIKALQKDFLDWDAYITYNKNKFKKIRFELEQTLSLSLQEEMR